MSSQARFSKAAEEDLVELRVWYEAQGGPELGQRFRAAAESAVASIVEEPGIGRVYEPSRGKKLHPRLAGLRQWRVDTPFNKSLISYLISDGGVFIIRVVRGERGDIDALFSGDA